MSFSLKLMPGAEPRFYRGGPTGCLLLHGFMASPGEIGWLGPHLHEKGHTVYVARLAGHGIDPTHMARMHWQDWYASALDGYALLRQQCEKVIVIGHSMGGLLAALLAASEKVDGIVISATPYALQPGIARYARLLNLALPYTNHPNEPELHQVIVAEQSRRGEAIIGRVHYPRWSTLAVAQFFALLKEARANLHRIEAPLLLLYAEADKTGTVADMEHFAGQVRSQQIEKVLIKEGAHIVFQDTGRESAFNAVSDFVASLL